MLAFSGPVCAELLQLVDGEALAVQGDLKAEAYEKDNELRVGLTIMASAIWTIQHKPEKRERKAVSPQPPPFDDDIGF